MAVNFHFANLHPNFRLFPVKITNYAFIVYFFYNSCHLIQDLCRSRFSSRQIRLMATAGIFLKLSPNPSVKVQMLFHKCTSVFFYLSELLSDLCLNLREPLNIM